ncbi:MAG TPA: FAD-binding oxidoreductase [Candidatus Limnocylindrales bacterium]|nr:FAD-binding oxidoreductase [Candidatus Limnocylindrales bacterium]
MTDAPTETSPAERVILPDAPQYNASLVARIDETESLGYFLVKFDGAATPFEAGQYMTIGVFVEDPTTPTGTRIVQRPYSVASDPGTADASGYEMYVRLVHGGAFTPLLWRLPVGHRMRMIGPKGKFTLEPDDDRTHLFISSGTGNAPFVAMMKMLLRVGRPRRAVFLNGVSYARDLGYHALLERWAATREYPVTYIPTVSRPQVPENAGWTGRWGRVETIVNPVCDEFGLTPTDTIAYICGNPDMIIAAEETLLGRGFPDAQVKKELYWPKGKEPTGAATEE